MQLTKILTLAFLGGLPFLAQGAIPEVKPYVANALVCKSCHQAQYNFWAKTNHASAYLVLFAKNSHFDWECISCHSLGFGAAEGFAKIAHPLVLADPGKDPKKTPYIETLMTRIFGDELAKGPLDSRLQPARYQKLHQRYLSEVEKVEDSKLLQKLYVGVQCENCHGNRNGHPATSKGVKTKVKEATCRTCHAPPNAPNFSPSMIPKVSCPLISKSPKS